MDAVLRTSAAGVGDNIWAEAERLFRKYGPMVTRRCRRLLCNEDDAADAAQEVFAKFLFDPKLQTVQYPSTLLWTMATNRCLNILRDKARRGGDEDGESLLEKIACMDSGQDIESAVHNRGVLRRIFGQHPKSTQIIAVLHLIDGLTLSETAREVGMSVAGVRKRLCALKKMVKGLEVYV